MKLPAVRLRLGLGLCLAAGAIACSSTPPDDFGDSSAIVYGRITSTSGVIVPGATAVIEIFPDTVRTNFGSLECGGSAAPVARATQQIDTLGNYHIEVMAPVTLSRACVELTGDPHGLYSDIGLKRAYVGFIQLRQLGKGARDSLRADLKYTETP